MTPSRVMILTAQMIPYGYSGTLRHGSTFGCISAVSAHEYHLHLTCILLTSVHVLALHMFCIER